MKHGFICFGDTGRMQIDGTNTALGLIRKQSFHCPKVQDAGQGTIKEVYFPTRVHPNTQMIAARASFWVRIGGQAFDNTNNNAFVSMPFREGLGGNIEIWEFGNAPVKVRNQRTGIVVINPATNQVVYNTNWGVANILHVQRLKLWPDTMWSMTMPNNGNNCAVVFGGGAQKRTNYDEYMEFESYFWRMNGSKLEVRLLVDTYSRPHASQSFESCDIPLYIMIIDTTGI